MERFIIGIDLGTTTCLAYGSKPLGEKKAITDPSGHHYIDSYIAFNNGEPVFGKTAKEAKGKVTKLYELKRLIGKKYDYQSFQSDLSKWPFRVVPGNDGLAEVEYDVLTPQGQQTRQDRPEVLTGLLLKYIKDTSNRFNEEKLPVSVIITVPARFNNDEKKATLAAASLAGFDDVQLFSEPSAAALAYVNGMKDKKERMNDEKESQTFVVYDFGGGTFDVSIIEYTNNEFRILETDGDTHLGGADIDNCLIDYYLKELEKKHPHTKTDTKRAKIKEHCEEVKKSLSIQAQAYFDFSIVNVDYDDGCLITRNQFEELIEPIVSKTLEILHRCINRWQEKNEGKEYDGIILVGGSSEIPYVRKRLNKEFPNRIVTDISPSQAVGEGAFIRGCIVRMI